MEISLGAGGRNLGLLKAYRAVHEWAGAEGVCRVLKLSLMGLGVVLLLPFLSCHWALTGTAGGGHGTIAVVSWGGHWSQSQLWLQQHRCHKQLWRQISIQITKKHGVTSTQHLHALTPVH